MGLSAAEIERVYERRYAGFRLGVAAILDDLDAAHDAVPDGVARALARPEAPPALAAAVRMLSPRRRQVVFLRYFADLSYAEIARVCRMSEGTVAATLAQAHAELQRHLQPEEAHR